MRGTGEGDQPYDYKPKSTMTNGTIDALAKRKVNGAVGNAEGATLTLNYKDGEKQIDVTPATVIVIYAPGSKDELKSRAKLYIPAAIRQEDRTLVTARVKVGRGVTPPM
jgi:hypothetical protein